MASSKHTLLLGIILSTTIVLQVKSLLASPGRKSDYTGPVLDEAQKRHLRYLMADQTFLDRLEILKKDTTRSGFLVSEIPTSLVTLNQDQKQHILQNYQDLFSSKPEQKSDNYLQYENQSLEARQISRPIQGQRICPAAQHYKNFVLAFDDNNEPVQFVQFPADDAQQWILEEECADERSNTAVARCGIASRLVNALIVNVNSQEIQHYQLRVKSCVSYVR